MGDRAASSVHRSAGSKAECGGHCRAVCFMVSCGGGPRMYVANAYGLCDAGGMV